MKYIPAPAGNSNQSFYWLRGPAQHCNPLLYRHLHSSHVATVRTKQEFLTFIHDISRSGPRFRLRKECPAWLRMRLTEAETDYIAVDTAGFINNRNRQSKGFSRTKYLLLSCERPIIVPHFPPLHFRSPLGRWNSHVRAVGTDNTSPSQEKPNVTAILKRFVSMKDHTTTAGICSAYFPRLPIYLTMLFQLKILYSDQRDVKITATAS